MTTQQPTNTSTIPILQVNTPCKTRITLCKVLCLRNRVRLFRWRNKAVKRARPPHVKFEMKEGDIKRDTHYGFEVIEKNGHIHQYIKITKNFDDEGNEIPNEEDQKDGNQNT